MVLVVSFVAEYHAVDPLPLPLPEVDRWRTCSQNKVSSIISR